ncbi:MAG: glycosyltransferase [Bacteroidaceae bacterium]|nr:glycosyltransferase [Bacteroidaceae bacterium]
MPKQTIDIISNQEQRRLLHGRGICVIIPTYNNAGTIVDVVQRTLLQCDDVIVVCDGCTDDTLSLIKDIEGIQIVSYERNEGKGTALKRGFSKALEMGFSYAITLDADGQHYPEDIPVLLEANIKHPEALIVGQRKGLENMERSKGSKFANSFSNFWFCVQTGHYLGDTQTGYRLYPLKKLRGLSFLTSRYEAELELLVFSSWHGVKLISEPVNVFYPPREERVSHFRPGLDFTRISILNTCLCVLAIVYGLPLAIFRFLATTFRTFHCAFWFCVVSLLVMKPIAWLQLILHRKDDDKSSGVRSIIHKSAVFIMKFIGIPGVKYSVENDGGEDFTKPALIISNHQSYLDLMILLSQTEKLVVLTNDWVWNSPFFGSVIRHAEYYPVSDGIEKIMPNLTDLVRRGYSIAIYPESTRSEDMRIQRFHKGAFYIAEQLKLDILPLVVYGAGQVMPKKSKLVHSGSVLLEIGKRIDFDTYSRVGTPKEVASWFRKWYIEKLRIKIY